MHASNHHSRPTPPFITVLRLYICLQGVHPHEYRVIMADEGRKEEPEAKVEGEAKGEEKAEEKKEEPEKQPEQEVMRSIVLTGYGGCICQNHIF